MKKTIFAVIAVTTLIIFGCNKSGDAPAVTSITGTWRYTGYSGGLAGFRFTPVDTVESYIQADTTARRILANYNGQQGCSTYTFVPTLYACTVPGVTLIGTINLNNTIQPLGSDSQFNVSIINDTLIVQPYNCADCFASYYVPVSKHFDWCTDTTGGK